MTWHIEKIDPNNTDQLYQLVDLYCYRMWGSEDSFGEYKQCPKCRRYFSEEKVAELSLIRCPDCQIELEDAWKPERVEKDIRGQLQKPGAIGFVAVVRSKVIGFAWTYFITPDEIRKHWGQEVTAKLAKLVTGQTIIYFDELGVEQSWRRQGIGTALVTACLKQYQNIGNDPLVFLRTHQNSPGLRLYTKIGLEVFSPDTEYGQGRVLLANHLSELRL